MKKHLWIRLLACAMAVLMVVPVLAGCSDDTEEENNGEVELLEGEEKKDFGGYTFVVYDYFESRWQPEAGQNDVDDTVLTIMDEVESLYNCNIEFHALNLDTAFDSVQTSVAAGDKFADLVITTMWSYGYLLGAGLMGDLNTLQGVDLTRDCWNQRVMDVLTIKGEIKGGGATFTDHSYLTWSCYFNKSLFEQMGHDPNELYTLVRNGEWTYSKFLEYAKEALRDQDGSGQVDSDDDIWGLVAPDGDYNRAAFLAMGCNFYGHDDDGNLCLACNNQHAYDVVEFMRGMFKKDKIWMSSSGEAFSEIMGHFVDGHSLFIMCSPGEEQLRTMEDDYGFLPQPKWDAAQESYIGMVDHNAPIFGITSTNQDLDKTGYITESIARRYAKVNDLTLDNWANTVWRSSEDDEMMRNYVAGHGGYDLAPIINNADSTLGTPMNYVFSCTMGAGTDFSSMITAAEDKLEARLSDYIDGRLNM